ncbi:MAG: lysophospholipase [Anaerolineae bacterium]|nr:lysophospholipase [Anaerolineae bacterium]
MQHTTGSFKTSDGFQIHTEAWLPDGQAKAVIVLVHGYAEHIGRYPHVVAHFVSQGYAVYGLDHRGHGQSGGERVYFDSFAQPISDLEQYFKQVTAAHPGKKIFMYGHSMGSIISLGFALRHQDQLAGLILTGTAVNADEAVSPVLIAVSNILSKLIPKNRMVAALPSSFLSHDMAVVQAYDSDPLNDRGKWRVRTGAALIRAGRDCRARAGELRLPLLILHGGSDQIAPVSGGQTIYDQAGSNDKTLKIYEGLYHEIHNEPEKETVLNDISAWLDKHI